MSKFIPHAPSPIPRQAPIMMPAPKSEKKSENEDDTTSNGDDEEEGQKYY